MSTIHFSGIKFSSDEKSFVSLTKYHLERYRLDDEGNYFLESKMNVDDFMSASVANDLSWLIILILPSYDETYMIKYQYINHAYVKVWTHCLNGKDDASLIGATQDGEIYSYTYYPGRKIYIASQGEDLMSRDIDYGLDFFVFLPLLDGEITRYYFLGNGTEGHHLYEFLPQELSFRYIGGAQEEDYISIRGVSNFKQAYFWTFYIVENKNLTRMRCLHPNGVLGIKYVTPQTLDGGFFVGDKVYYFNRNKIYDEDLNEVQTIEDEHCSTLAVSSKHGFYHRSNDDEEETLHPFKFTSLS